MSPNGQETIGLTLHVDMYRKLFPAEYMKKCIANNVRPDARDLNAFRSVNVNTNVIQTASSSSLVKFGKTSVLTAAKLAVGTPAVATPDQGEIAIQVHLTPLCSTRFTIGRQSEESQSLASILTRIIVGSRMVEMSDLSIEKGKSAWKIFLDVYCLDHDGNVLDVALLSIMSTLKSLILPATIINENDHIVSIKKDGDGAPLRLHHLPFSVSFAYLHGVTIVDPSQEEETLAECTFSIVYNTLGQLCTVYKPGGQVIPPTILQECMQISKKRAQTLVKQINFN